MKDLRIGLPILATTTCMLDNEVFKLHPTTLVDAYTSDSNGLRIKLGEGHWGACPARDRVEVAINSNEVKEMANARLTKYIEKCKELKSKQRLFFVNKNNTHSVTISALNYNRKVNSLAEGSFVEYRSGYASMKISNDNLPQNFFYTIEEAIEFFVKVSKTIVG